MIRRICNTALNGPNVVYSHDLKEVFCLRCAPYSHTCVTCAHRDGCDFETNPSPLPKQVQMTQRQGNAVISQVVKNPERIKITCQNGCLCWSEEYGCGRQYCMDHRVCLNNNWSFKNEEVEE